MTISRMPGRLRAASVRPVADEFTPATGPILLRNRTVGDSGLRVFPLAIGGNVFGWTVDAAATESVLDSYHELGGNFIDTADSYAAGRSETMIGNWMHDRRNRSDIVVATKVGKSADSPGVTQEAIAQAVHASLERLRTDHIDLLYLHIDDETVPFEETLLAVDALIGAGKVRYFGASHHSGNRLIEARVIAAQSECAPLIAVQNHYNLVHRGEYEGTLASVAAQQRLGVMPRFALASGFLSGKYRSKADLAHSRGHQVAAYLTRRGLKILAVLDRVAEEQQVAPATIALAWLLTKPNVVAPVASASAPDQVLDLMAAATVQLTRHQVADLDRVSA
ncbi:MAG TPA: aldo/keto reductase [Marisediminicola sp.]|nr:aldo/keto reductase [Marisediminicola sp.]